MGKAPTPGASRRAAIHEQAKTNATTELRLTVKGDTYSLFPNSLPFNVKTAIRKACGGLPFSAYWSGELVIDLDSIQVMVYAARLVAGDEATFQDVLAQYDWDNLDPDDIDMEVDDGTDDPAEITEDADPNG